MVLLLSLSLSVVALLLRSVALLSRSVALLSRSARERVEQEDWEVSMPPAAEVALLLLAPKRLRGDCEKTKLKKTQKTREKKKRGSGEGEGG